MDTLKVYCAGTAKNTGKPACALMPGLDRGVILAPVGYDYIEEANFADAATFKTFLEGKLQHANPAQRWHYIGPFEGMEDKSTKAAYQTLPYGAMQETNKAFNTYRYQITKGGLWYLFALQSFNKMSEYYRAFRIDNQKNIMGTISTEVDANGHNKMQGFSINMLSAEAWEAPTPSAVAGLFWTIGYEDSAEMNEGNLYAINAGVEPRLILGVRDITLKDVTPAGAADGIHHVEIWADGGQYNVTKSIGSSVATATNFIFRRKDNGNAITKTAALNTAGTAVVLTASLVDADYVNGDDMEILWDMATAASNGVKWFESPVALVVEARN